MGGRNGAGRRGNNMILTQNRRKSNPSRIKKGRRKAKTSTKYKKNSWISFKSK